MLMLWNSAVQPLRHSGPPMKLLLKLHAAPVNSEAMTKLCSFFHYGDLYSAFSRLLLRSASDPCTAKKNGFQARVECVRMNPGEQLLCQRKSIPHGRANHRECMGLPCGSTGKRDKEDPHSREQRELQPLVFRVGQKRLLDIINYNLG